MNKRCFFALFCLVSMGAVIKTEAAVTNQFPAESKGIVAPKIEETTKSAKEEKSIKKIKKEYYVVVDAQKIITDTGLDKDVTQELTNLQQKYQKELKEMADGVLKMEQDLKTKASTLSADVLKAKQAELEEENQKMQMRLNRANNELRSADMNARTKVFQQLQQYAQDTLITKGGHKVVFERGGGILAFVPGIDKSADVTKVIKTDMAKKVKAKEVKAKNGQAKMAGAEIDAQPIAKAAGTL